MDEQMTLDAVASRAGRDAGVKAADEHAHEAWKSAADACIRVLAARGTPFVSDDVWALELPMPREGRALGARFQAAHRAGLIRPTGVFRATTQKKSHASPAREWVGT